LFQVDITEIVVGEADEPDAVVDFFDSEALTGSGRACPLQAIELRAEHGIVGAARASAMRALRVS
jgi:hypothetical protein